MIANTTSSIQLFNDHKTLNRGWLICFEGIDGSGKSTLVNNISNYLFKQQYPYKQFKEPTNSKWGEAIKSHLSGNSIVKVKPEQELELFLRDRLYNLYTNILPALYSNHIVLLDRYYWSTIVYQSVRHGFDVTELLNFHYFLRKPDMTFWINTDPDVAISRMRIEGKKLDEFEASNNSEKLINVYRYLADLNKDRTTILDGNQDAHTVSGRTILTLRNLRIIESR